MIVYAAIARAKDAAILVEVISADISRGTNVGQVVATMLQHLRDHPELIADGDRRTFVQRNEAETDFFSHFIEACSVALGDTTTSDSGSVGGGAGEREGLDEHYFHLYLKDGVYYCCLGDEPDARDQKVNFHFLEHLHGEFTRLYRPWRINGANAYAFDKNFSPSLRSAMHYHNVNHRELARDQKVQALLAQVEDFKDVMGRNINILMENSQKATALMSMSTEMQHDAQVFKKRSSALKNMEKRRNCLNLAFGAGVVLVLLYVFVLSICGARLEQCQAPSNSNGGGGGSAGSGNTGNDDGGGGNR